MKTKIRVQLRNPYRFDYDAIEGDVMDKHSIAEEAGKQNFEHDFPALLYQAIPDKPHIRFVDYFSFDTTAIYGKRNLVQEIENFAYYTANFDNDFITLAWGFDNMLATHLTQKWAVIVQKSMQRFAVVTKGAFMDFVMELDSTNKHVLFQFIANRYNGVRGDVVAIDTTPYIDYEYDTDKGNLTEEHDKLEWAFYQFIDTTQLPDDMVNACFDVVVIE